MLGFLSLLLLMMSVSAIEGPVSFFGYLLGVDLLIVTASLDTSESFSNEF